MTVLERLMAWAPMLKNLYPPIEGRLDSRSVRVLAQDAAADLTSAASELSAVAERLATPDSSALLPDVSDAIEDIAASLDRIGRT